MKWNRREMLAGMLAMFAVMLSGVSILAGCGAAALPWITMGLNLLATLLPTLPSLIAAFGNLIGKNILTAAQIAKLTQIFTGVQNLFQQVQADLTAFETSSDPTLIAKIQDLLNQIKTQLSTIITDVQITDPATVAKITAIANAFIDLASNILLLLPTVAANGKLMAKHISKAQLAKLTPEAWASRFNEAVHKPSGNPALDAAFEKVKAEPKHGR